MIADAARTLFPDTVVVATEDPAKPATGLFPIEESAVARAIDKRQREFAAGRRAARRAFAEFGLTDPEIAQGSDRAPIWPPGFTGSLSHCDGACIAAVARQAEIRSLGVDIEPHLPIEEPLWRSILVSREQDWIRAQPPDRQGILVKLIFSAKEAAYKCQFPASQTVFGFSGFCVDLDLDAQAYNATFRDAVEPFAKGDQVSGRFAITDDFILTGAII